MRFGTNKDNKRLQLLCLLGYYGSVWTKVIVLCYLHSYDVLYQAVLERLQYWAKAVQQDEEKVLNKIQKVGNAERIREKRKSQVH